MVLVFVLVEPAVELALLCICVNASAHQFVEMACELVVEVSSAGREDGWICTSGDATA